MAEADLNPIEPSVYSTSRAMLGPFTVNVTCEAAAFALLCLRLRLSSLSSFPPSASVILKRLDRRNSTTPSIDHLHSTLFIGD